MKLSDKETYESVVAYGKYKATIKFWKILLLGFMGGAFIALGYIGAFTMKDFGITGGNETLGKFLGAAIFPTGIIMCVFLGGSLFTSDALSILPAIQKEIKPLTALRGWGLVWIGNIVGALFIAILATYSGFLTDGRMNVLEHYVSGKMNKDWYMIFFSGILTNMLVAGAIWMSLSTKSAGAKVILIWFPITLFAAAGFEHIVANFFIFWMGILNNGETFKAIGHHAAGKVDMDAWKFFYNNLIPTTIGNFIGGAVVIALPYYFMNKKYGATKAAK